jgi:hypothetical protein
MNLISKNGRRCSNLYTNLLDTLSDLCIVKLYFVRFEVVKG